MPIHGWACGHRARSAPLTRSATRSSFEGSRAGGIEVPPLQQGSSLRRLRAPAGVVLLAALVLGGSAVAATPSPDPPPLAVTPDPVPTRPRSDPTPTRSVAAPPRASQPAPTPVAVSPPIVRTAPAVVSRPPGAAPKVKRPAAKPSKQRTARVATAKTPQVIASLPRDRPLLPRLAAAVVVRAEPLDRGLLALGGAVLALAALGGAVVLLAARQALRELAT